MSTLSSVLKSYCPVVTASVGVGGSSTFLLQHQPVLQERNLLRPVQRFQSATVCSCRVSEQACPLYFGPPQAGASRAWASGGFTRLFWTSVEVVAAGRPISAIGSRASNQVLLYFCFWNICCAASSWCPLGLILNGYMPTLSRCGLGGWLSLLRRTFVECLHICTAVSKIL